MDFFKAMDVYCERVDPSYWAEPLNAASNIGFIIVGFIWLKRSKDLKNFWTKFFSINCIIVGIGSYLFHTHANIWSLFADIIPIMFLVGSFFFYTFRKVLLLNLGSSIGLTSLLIVIGIFLEKLKLGFLNGSEVYAHVFVALIIFSQVLRKLQPQISKLYMKAAFIFTLSLTFRTIDHLICSTIPFGSHFLWHAINAYLIYTLINISYLNQKV